jgi:hypothetical protein
MCREIPLIPVDRVMDTKRIIGRRKVCGGGEAQGVPDRPKNFEEKKLTFISLKYM